MNKVTSISRTLLFLMALISSSVFAHSPLVASFPENGEILPTAPTEISLSFKEDVKLIQVRIQSEEIDKKIRPELVEELTRHSLDLPTLGAGEYTASWRAMGEDGHVMKGKIMFTILP